MKIGFLGGTFDPPHIGHTKAAYNAAVKLGLDQLFLIPTSSPPHKTLPKDTAGTVHRLEMTRLAAHSIDNIDVQVSDMEVRRGGKSYTADTVEELKKMYPGGEFWLICGGDMFASLPNWYKSEWLTENLNFAVFSRVEKDAETKRFTEEYSKLYKMNVSFMEAEPTVISSTELRDLLKNGGGGGYLTPEVYAYILEHRLYNVKPDPDALWELVRPWIGEKRIPHVLGCRSEAVRLAMRWCANSNDIRNAEIAAILHDITKKFDVNEQLLLCGKYDITVKNFSLAGHQEYAELLHAETGAAIAYKIFGIPVEIRDAIRWHTTGRPGMTLLEKIIYLADTIEPTRKFEGVEELRKTAYSDIDRAMKKSLEMSLEYIKKRGIEPHKTTTEALEYFNLM